MSSIDEIESSQSFGCYRRPAGPSRRAKGLDSDLLFSSPSPKPFLLHLSVRAVSKLFSTLYKVILHVRTLTADSSFRIELANRPAT
jgi:hypothetical protein